MSFHTYLKEAKHICQELEDIFNSDKKEKEKKRERQIRKPKENQWTWDETMLFCKLYLKELKPKEMVKYFCRSIASIQFKCSAAKYYMTDGKKGVAFGAWDLYECLNILTNQEKQPVYNWDKEKYKEHYQKNKELYKQYSKKYHEQNKEQHSKKVKEYYQKNKEHCKQYSKKYYHQNKEERSKKQKKYYEKNKETLKKHMAQYMKLRSEYEKTWDCSTCNNYNHNHLLRISMDLFQ